MNCSNIHDCVLCTKQALCQFLIDWNQDEGQCFPTGEFPSGWNMSIPAGNWDMCISPIVPPISQADNKVWIVALIIAAALIFIVGIGLVYKRKISAWFLQATEYIFRVSSASESRGNNVEMGTFFTENFCNRVGYEELPL